MSKVKIEVSGEDGQQGLAGTGVKAEEWSREIIQGESYTEVRIACDAIAEVRPSNHTLKVKKQDKEGNWVTKYTTKGKKAVDPNRPTKPIDPEKQARKEKAAKNEKKSKLRAVSGGKK